MTYELYDYPKSVSQVNAFFRQNGLSLKVVNGGGYFYWEDADGLVEKDSVFVNSASQLTFSQWLEEAKERM